MPFGLVNSGSTYQRLMDESLRPVIHAHPYIDDICVHSAEFNIHIADLKSALEALSKANVQIRRDKCSFGYSFLNHNPLVWLRRQKDLRGKFARWIQELEILAYEIKYVKGAENGPAYFLSSISTDIDWEVND